MKQIGVEVEVHQLYEVVPSSHAEIELLFLLSGQADLTVGSETFHMEKNSVIVVNSEKRHSLAVVEEGLVCRVVIEFQTVSDYLGSTLFLFWCNSVLETQGDYDKLISLLQKIVATKLTRGGQEDFGTYGLYFQLLDLLVKKYLVDHNDVRYKENRDEVSERIHEITYYVQNNYNREITLNELAERLYLSNAYLSRFFKKTMGQNFKDYLNNIRLHHAVDDLLGSEKNMTKIAMDNGFPSVSRFNQVFKESYQMSPLAYREAHFGEAPKKAGNREEDVGAIMEQLRTYVQSERLLGVDDAERVQCQLVDVSNRRYAHKNWNRAINIGPLTDLMQAKVQRDLLKIHEELGFTYVRFWNLFDNFICDKNAKFNFDRIDRSIEFLLEHNMKPFILLGGKERNIMGTLGEVIFREETTEARFIQNPEAWSALIKSFCANILECFGQEEVSTWVFELRKPNLWEYCYEGMTEQQFFDWFEIANKTIKKYYPLVMVGGCEFAINWNRSLETEIDRVFEFWKKIDCVPDFFSLGVYPYEDRTLSMNMEYLREDLLSAKRILRKHAMEHIPIMATEWSNTLSNRNIYNESCYKGAYIIQNMTMNMDIADKIIYWSASDVIGEFADTGDILYGGVGLINKNGIPKPSFFAYEFLQHLYKYQIFCTRNYCVTTDGNRNYSILCNNLKQLSYAYCSQEGTNTGIGATEYEQYFDDLESLILKMQLRNVDNGEYEIRRHLVSKEYGSILDELIGWECISNIKHQDVEYLERICRPKLTLGTITAVDNRMILDVELPSNAFELIEIKYRIARDMDAE